jgi:septum formation protein
MHSGLSPQKLAELLAWEKAASLRSEEPSAAIIGCDQVVCCENQTFGKPMTAAGAIDQLTVMAGRSHELITAMVVAHAERIYRHTDVSTLRMRPLSRASIERYVAADLPFDCAGSYKLESRGIALFTEIRSHDYTAIMGLPLMSLAAILRELGWEIP